MTDRLRTHLSEQLAKKVEAHGLVVWDDPEHYYTDVAQSVSPPGIRFVKWEGSFYELRHQVEGLLGAEDPPALVVYVPTEAPDTDPLEEIRAAAHRYRTKLGTLLRQALIGQLTEQRIEQIGREARTIGEAEAAVSGGESADVRLISLLGSADTAQMVLAVMCAERDEEIAKDEAWEQTSSLLGRAIGSELSGMGEDLRRAAMRQLLLTELDERLGELPGVLASAWSRPSNEQRKRALSIMEAWRRDDRRRDRYATAAAQTERDLDLGSALVWHEGLIHCDAFPAIEALALSEAVRLLDAGEFQAARDLAQSRGSCMWARTTFEGDIPGAEVWGPRWRVVVALSSLRIAVENLKPPLAALSEQLKWYEEAGWQVDREHRRMELALSELHIEGDLERPISEGRAVYEEWLDHCLERFTSSVAGGGTANAWPLRQVEIHKRFVSSSNNGLTAYVWVDALRLEIGRELADALKKVCSKVDMHSAQASSPTITPVGMASLCPGAEVDLSLDLNDRGRLVVGIDGRDIKSVRERIELLRAAHGEVVDLPLSDVVSRGERELARAISGASLVLVRSQEMDAAGESGMLAVTWTSFEAVKQQLVRAVARLAQAGVSRFVIAADHGFVVLSRGLRSDRVVKAPRGGTGELHRRGWVGRGAMTTQSTLRVPLVDTGARSDLDLIVPRTLAVFAGPGTRQFFHGGLSAQELLVPVIVAEAQPSVAPKSRTMRISVAGNRLTTGAFSVNIAFEPDLFTSKLEVRVLGRRSGSKENVARLVSGEGYDAASGTVTLSAEGQNILTFQLVANLERGETVEIAVLDARTDRELGSATVAAAAAISVEDDLA